MPEKPGLYIANSYQTPNFVIDYLDQFLTPIESKVYHKAMREIIGYHENLTTRQNCISLSQFVDGKTSRKTGERLSYGCGLSRKTVQKALTSLHNLNILKKVKHAHNGTVFEINFDTDAFDWPALEGRITEKDQRYAAHMANMRDHIGDDDHASNDPTEFSHAERKNRTTE